MHNEERKRKKMVPADKRNTLCWGKTKVGLEGEKVVQGEGEVTVCRYAHFHYY